MITLIGQPPTITLNTSPVTYTSFMPVYNDIVYTVTSDNNTACKFQYIADIYINGNYIQRLKLFPNLQGNANFKINRILENYISNTLITNISSIFTYNDNHIINYEVKFGETYDTSSNCDGTNINVYDDLLSTGIQYTWNGSMQYKEWYNYIINQNILNQFFPSTTAPAKFLTNQPSEIMIGRGQRSELSYLVHPSHQSNVSKLVIVCYDKNNIVLSTDYITNTNPSNKYFQVIGVGTADINQYFSTTRINNKVYKYTVYLANGSNQRTSEIKTFIIDRRNSNYTKYRFKWLNILGGYDSYTFDLVSNNTVNIERKEISKITGDYNGDDTFIYNLQDRGRMLTSVNAKESITVSSNWLTEKENIWIEQLYTSLDVYIQDINKLYPFYNIQADPELTPKDNPIFYMNLPFDSDDVTTLLSNNVFIDKDDWSYNRDINQNIMINQIGDNLVQISDILANNILSDCGVIYSNINNDWYGIIVTNNNYQIKNKSTTKNINQQITFEWANSKNIQRN